ncbi:MAG: hypothetical protein JNG84_00095 [Archangium sp.]|nr:hypothetical protein [Archangium sp.]
MKAGAAWLAPFLLWESAGVWVQRELVQTGDAAEYLRMAAGLPAAMPFARRVAVPWLAGRLSLEPQLGFRLIAHASALLFFALTFHALLRLKSSPRAAAVGLCFVAVSPGFLYLHRNPFLTDAAWLAVQAGLIQLWLMGAVAASAVLFVAALLVRENAVFFPLLWLPSRPRVAAGVGLLFVFGTVALSRAIPSEGGASMFDEVTRVATNKGWGRVLGDAVGAWHWLWLVMGWAVVRALRSSDQRGGWLGLALFVPAVAACVVAINTQRMMTFVAPAVAWAVASEVERRGASSFNWLVASVACLYALSVVLFPSVVWDAPPVALKFITIGVAVIPFAVWLLKSRGADGATSAPNHPT